MFAPDFGASGAFDSALLPLNAPVSIVDFGGVVKSKARCDRIGRVGMHESGQS